MHPDDKERDDDREADPDRLAGGDGDGLPARCVAERPDAAPPAGLGV
jgi:hypothetical protein